MSGPVADKDVLGFGKYKNNSIEEVFAMDPNYCRWLVNQDVLTNKSETVKAFLKEKFVNGATSPILTFGKHSGKSIDYIRTVDPGYLGWLAKNQFIIEKCPKIHESVVAALEAIAMP